MWPQHVQAGCVFPFRCTLTSAHELETLLLSSLFRSLSDEHRTSSWPAHSKTHRVQIPGRINARLSWINIIQTCSIPACLSQRVYKKMPKWMRKYFSQLSELWQMKQGSQFVFWVDLVFINCISFYCLKHNRIRNTSMTSGQLILVINSWWNTMLTSLFSFNKMNTMSW